MQAWNQFYAVIGGAAATLLGLLFVAVSINAAIILGTGREHTRRLAEQAFQSYSAIITVALISLFPGIELAQFGLAVFCVTAASGAWVVVRLFMMISKPGVEPRVYALRRYFSSLVGFGMLLVSAARMYLNRGESRNLLAISTIVLLASATLVSWGLLIGISRARLSAQQG
jgi:hypothetical protein